MAVYRFKVYLEDDEDVQRFMELTSSSKFEDLHYFILQSIEFDNKHEASFFISDDNWRRGQEIKLKKHGDEDMLMSAAKLSTFINDPHQKIIYVYDYEKEWGFHVELVGITLKEDPKVTYPRLTKSAGKAPKQYGNILRPSSENDDDEFSYITEKAQPGGEDEHDENGIGIGDEENSESEFGDVESTGRDDD